MTDPLLEVNDLVVRAGQGTKLSDISLSVSAGEMVAILGPNGAGKTTLMRCLSGLLPPSEGGVNWKGRPLPRGAHRVARGGLVLAPQNHPIFPSITVDEHLRLAKRGARTAAGGEPEDVFPELASLRHQRAGSMSGGQRQMLSMAMALALKPDLLMLDEPSSGLAPKIVATVFSITRRIADSGLAVLIVEQNANETLQISDRGIVLENGSIALTGASTELRANRRVRESYLGL